ncbi:hypothetical protein IQ25_03915 [Novosphingobium taihuense]|uniref:Uncharacterized protein n=1 Tax=Novosphingobium taihuense TaxID=260085 RepID=A0A7W7AEX6_9SPHN|nr:hypothetical protein [Novosphingobium taihuense]TWH79704.1 hypothetical protein IQ25_03915 [Novosphingobium taihuense]
MNDRFCCVLQIARTSAMLAAYASQQANVAAVGPDQRTNMT